MNNELVNKRLMPESAIIVYKEKGQYGTEYYLERREIRAQNGGYAFMAPQPLSKNMMKQIASSFVKRSALDIEFGGLIAPHLLLGVNKPGTMAVIWYRPAMTRQLNFSETLGIKGKPQVSIPATLYLVLNTTLYVFALLSDDRPDGRTKLHQAPFFNIYVDGNVCLGTAPVGKMRAKTFEEEAHRFERGFYMAEQNGGTSKPCKTDLKELWAKQIKKGGDFPAKAELIQHPKYKTLNDLISKLIGNNDSYEEEDETDTGEDFPGDYDDLEEEIEVEA